MKLPRPVMDTVSSTVPVEKAITRPHTSTIATSLSPRHLAPMCTKRSETRRTSSSPVTRDRLVTGFPDRSPETQKAEEKINYLSQKGAAVLCYCLCDDFRSATKDHAPIGPNLTSCEADRRRLSPDLPKGSAGDYSCGCCDVCQAVTSTCAGSAPSHVLDAVAHATVTTLKGGITNLMLHIEYPGAQDRALRIFGLGSEHIIDRKKERGIVEYLADNDLGKRVFARFVSEDASTCGQIEEWIEGASLSPEEMREVKTSHKIAAEIARLHVISVPEFLQEKYKHHIDVIADRPTDGSAQSKPNDTVPSNSEKSEELRCSSSFERVASVFKHDMTDSLEDVSRISMPHILKAYEWIEQAVTLIREDGRFEDIGLINLELVKEKLDTILSWDENLRESADLLHNNQFTIVHGDLLSGNIVKQGSETIRFIDFEYTDLGSPSYDLANHFNECTGFECSEADYDKFYPDENTQRAFISIYVDEVIKLRKVILSEEEIETQKQRLYREVQVNALVSHFYWGIWGLIKALWQSTEKQIEFDFKTYAFQRLTAGLSLAFASRIKWQS